nr:transglycosylase SLT domain-containing protein [Mesobaculum littorinae]
MLAGCATKPEPTEPSATRPVMRWDHRPEAPLWTDAALNALQSNGAALPNFTPADIETYCPGYATASTEDRAAFWAGLFSALAEHESTWNPGAVGGGGQWYGLLQILPSTARSYGCRATSGAALKDGAANLSCAVRIASRQVLSRGNVSRGMRDWGPFHSASKRSEMQAWTRAQPYCAVKVKAK